MDYTLKAQITRLRKISLYLFLFTNIAIFGTLFTHNILTSSKYLYNYTPLSNQNLQNIDCNENNNFCYGYSYKTQSKKLDECPINFIYDIFNIEEIGFAEKDQIKFHTLLFDENKKIKPEYKNYNIFVSFKEKDKKNSSCIRNYPKSYFVYKIFPQFNNLVINTKLNPNYFDPTGKKVNPFFYGETSISNIAKRYPLYLIFKPFLYIASLLMIIYWIYTKKIILSFDKSDKIQTYYILGILSGVFLFFHVLFLGSEIENELFTKLRRYIIAFFILFELMAQFFLIKKLLSIKKIIDNFVNDFVLKLKWFFVMFFLISTFIIIGILIIFDLPKEVDYVIEWNYFVLLSFYYFLTFYLWKKN